jgi:hypothetical protein
MLRRQPSPKDRARKWWEAILGLRYFGPAKVAKETVRGEGSTCQEKVAHAHVVLAVPEVPFWAPFDAVFDTSCTGNERCAVNFVECPSHKSGVSRQYAFSAAYAGFIGARLKQNPPISQPAHLVLFTI